jgi:hypothetical protein
MKKLLILVISFLLFCSTAHATPILYGGGGQGDFFAIDSSNGSIGVIAFNLNIMAEALPK